MHQCSICGAEVARIKMQDKSEVEVHLWPLPYKEGQGQQGKELITLEGKRVQALSCFPSESAGTAYLEHKH